MIKKISYLLVGMVLMIAGTVYAAPYFTYQQTILPQVNGGNDLGTSTAKWRNIFITGSDGCLTLASGIITSTGSACGSGSGGTFPFTVNSWGNSTTSTLGFLNGFLSTASSTISAPLRLSSLSQGFLFTGSGGLVQPIASSSINLSWFNNDAGFITSSSADGYGFITDSYAGNTVQSTTTGLWLKDLTPYSLIASSTLFTYASSSQLDVTGNATSTFNAPLQAPIIDKGGLVYDVRAYGAKFDGVTDDSTAVQSVFDLVNARGGGTVVFPAGTSVWATSTIVYSNTNVIGAGSQSTIIQTQSTTGNLPGGSLMRSGVSSDNIKIKGMKLLGHKLTGGTTGSGLVFPAGGVHSFIQIEDVDIRFFPDDNLYMDDPILCQVENSYFRDAGRDGINVYLGTTCTFTANYTTGNDRYGIHLLNHTTGVMNNHASEYNSKNYRIQGGGNHTLNSPYVEITMNANSCALGSVAAYSFQSTQDIIVNSGYSNSFAYLSGCPAYHIESTSSVGIQFFGFRGRALASAEGGLGEAPTYTALIDSSSEVMARDVGFIDLTGGGMSGSFTSEVTSGGIISAINYFIDSIDITQYIKNVIGALFLDSSTIDFTYGNTTSTAGKTTDGGDIVSTSADRKRVSSTTSSVSGTLVSGATRLYLSSSGTSSTTMVVYSDTAGAPDALLAVSDEVVISNTSEQEIAYTFSGANQISITSGTPIWVGVLTADPGTPSVNISRDSTASGNATNADTYSDGASNPFGTVTTQTGVIDSYINIEYSSMTAGVKQDANYNWTGLHTFLYSSSTVYSSFVNSSTTNARIGSLTLSTSTAGTLKVNASGIVWSDTSSPASASSTLLADTNYWSGGNVFTNSTSTSFGVTNLRALSSAGLDLFANNGTPIAIFGAGNSANATFYGGVNVTGNLSVLGTSLLSSAYSSSTVYSSFVTSSTTLGLFGSVGIGTTGTPSGGKLQIIQSVDTNAGGLTVTNSSGGASNRIWMDSTGNARFDAGGTAGGLMLFNGAGTGNGAIGTTTIGIGKFTLNTATAPQLTLSVGAGLPQWTMRNAGGNLYFSTTTVAGTATTSTSALTITNGGEYLISTTTAGTLKITNGLVWADTSSGSSQWSDVTGGINYASGKVGVGSTTPWGMFSLLNTNSATTPSLSIATSTDSTYGQLLFVNSTTSTQISAGQNGGLRVSEMGARVGIGLWDYEGFGGLLDQLTVRGRINTEDWLDVKCDNTQIPNLSADGAMTSCSGFQFAEDGTGTTAFQVPTGGGAAYTRVAAAVNNDGAGVFTSHTTGSGWLTLASSTPVMETNLRIRNTNSTTTMYFIGFSNVNIAGSTYETQPTAGCFFTASSTQANWIALCSTNASTVTMVDTGIASTSVTNGTSGTGYQFYKFRIEADATKARFYIKENEASSLRLVAEISTTYPANTLLNAGHHYGIVSINTSSGFDFFRTRFWWRDSLPSS